MTTEERKEYAQKIRLRYYARDPYTRGESDNPHQLTHDALAEVIIRLLEIEGRLEGLAVSVEKPLERIAESLENILIEMSPGQSFQLFKETGKRGDDPRRSSL